MTRLSDVLADLDLLADEGNNGARHAAAVLRGQRRPGRPASYDTAAALLHFDRLIASGRGREAASTVARATTAEPAEQHAIAQALRAHRRKKSAAIVPAFSNP